MDIYCGGCKFFWTALAGHKCPQRSYRYASGHLRPAALPEKFSLSLATTPFPDSLLAAYRSTLSSIQAR